MNGATQVRTYRSLSVQNRRSRRRIFLFVPPRTKRGSSRRPFFGLPESDLFLALVAAAVRGLVSTAVLTATAALTRLSRFVGLLLLALLALAMLALPMMTLAGLAVLTSLILLVHLCVSPLLHRR